MTVTSTRELLMKRAFGLRTAVVSDSMDALGLGEQAMSASIHALEVSLKVCGFARTLLYAPTRRVADWESTAFRVELRAIDSLAPGDVVVASTIDACLWGELLSTAAHLRGAVGAVVDAYSRDLEETIALGFPVFARGAHPSDSFGRGEAIAADVSISCGGVQVSAGDLIVGDRDGVVVVPAERIDEVVEEAERRGAAEGVVKNGLLRGESLLELYEEHHIL